MRLATILSPPFPLPSAERFPDTDPWSRYIRAVEVGHSATSVKYEVAVRLRTKRDGAVLRSQLRLPHPVHSDGRICAICPPGSKAARSAIDAGADIVGEDEVFEAIKAGKIDFTLCVAHSGSVAAMNKAGLGRILGPRGLMPSAKMGTVVDDVGGAVHNLRGGNTYRERQGVVRMAIGQLGFSPEQLKNNLSTFIGQLRRDILAISDQNPKDVAEVVS